VFLSERWRGVKEGNECVREGREKQRWRGGGRERERESWDEPVSGNGCV
jgi:hypothetical protein